MTTTAGPAVLRGYDEGAKALESDARDLLDQAYQKLAWAYDDHALAARTICEWAVLSAKDASL